MKNKDATPAQTILEQYLNPPHIPSDGLREAFDRAGQDGLLYRGLPFFSWNGDLDPEELRRQVREMKKAGLAGFFMHGRTGLITEYLSEHWMACVEACIDEAKKVGMHAWLYDENGFPSGGADGRVAQGGPDYERKSLCCVEETALTFQWKDTTLAAFAAERNGDSFEHVRPLSNDPSAPHLDRQTVILHFFYTLHGYVDVLSKQAIGRFIDLTYGHYLAMFGDRFGTEIPGIFTDEPSYGLLPWSFELPERFRRETGEGILDALPGLFYRVPGFQKARHDFWSTVVTMFVEAYMGQIGPWCQAHGLALTGHVAWAETLMGQMTFHGASMPSYEPMQLPGTNHLAVRLMDAMREKQLTSVARQFSKPRVLSETSGGMGWGVDFEHVKWVMEWQLALGVNLFCPHLNHYTLRGLTKRDVPPSYHYQQPWWNEYKLLNDYIARLSFVLTQGKRTADLLVIHPIGSAWTLFDGTEISGGVDTHGGAELVAYNDRQAEICNALLAIHRDFDYGDELLLSRHGTVEGDRLRMGDVTYGIVILPELLSIRRSTLDLLHSFSENGGALVCIGPPPAMIAGVFSEEPAEVFSRAHHLTLPPWPADFQKAGRFFQPKCFEGTLTALKTEMDRISPPPLQIKDATGRETPHIFAHESALEGGWRSLFLVNISREETLEATVKLSARDLSVERWDAETGETERVPSRQEGDLAVLSLRFLPMQSHLLVLKPKDSRVAVEHLRRETLATVDLSGQWSVACDEPNALTIDYCRWASDGGSWSPPVPTLKLFGEWTQRMREHPGSAPLLALEYAFEVDPAASLDLGGLVLVVETPELFAITVNGQQVSSKDVGWWRDIAFRKIPIGTRVKPGENRIRLTGKWTPRTEIESIYLLGDFGVRACAPYREGDRQTALTDGGFVLSQRPNTVDTGNFASGMDLTTHGYPFYAGNAELTRIVSVPAAWFHAGSRRLFLEMNPPHAVLVRAIVNGHDVGAKAWRPFEFDVTRWIRPGDNEITLKLCGSCRNLLGPHHHWRGEVLYTGVAFGFTKSADEDEPQVPQNTWLDRYCFVQFGLSDTPKLRLEGI
ncbi:MAG: glycosyl hydrolase [Candidatus Latescibacterota bacterium]